MKVLIVEPMGSPYIKDIEGTLEEMQSIVGGLIQAIYPFDDPEIALICTDEGKLLNMPLNRALYNNGKIYDIIAGTFFLCQVPTDSENFESLTDEQIKVYKEKYKYPEIYVK